MLLTVKFLNLILPLHEVITILHDWFHKEIYEISPLLRECGINEIAIDQSLVKAGLRSAEVPFIPQAIAELTERMKDEGIAQLIIRQRLLAAGFSLDELKISTHPSIPPQEPQEEVKKFEPDSPIKEINLSK